MLILKTVADAGAWRDTVRQEQKVLVLFLLWERSMPATFR